MSLDKLECCVCFMEFDTQYQLNDHLKMHPEDEIKEAQQELETGDDQVGFFQYKRNTYIAKNPSETPLSTSEISQLQNSSSLSPKHAILQQKNNNNKTESNIINNTQKQSNNYHINISKPNINNINNKPKPLELAPLMSLPDENKSGLKNILKHKNNNNINNNNNKPPKFNGNRESLPHDLPDLPFTKSEEAENIAKKKKLVDNDKRSRAMTEHVFKNNKLPNMKPGLPKPSRSNSDFNESGMMDLNFGNKNKKNGFEQKNIKRTQSKKNINKKSKKIGIPNMNNISQPPPNELPTSLPQNIPKKMDTNTKISNIKKPIKKKVKNREKRSESWLNNPDIPPPPPPNTNKASLKIPYSNSNKLKPKTQHHLKNSMLADFIEEMKASNMTEDELKMFLTKKGYTDAQITTAFDRFAKRKSSQLDPAQLREFIKKKKSSKKVISNINEDSSSDDEFNDDDIFGKKHNIKKLNKPKPPQFNMNNVPNTMNNKNNGFNNGYNNNGYGYNNNYQNWNGYGNGYQQNNWNGFQQNNGYGSQKIQQNNGFNNPVSLKEQSSQESIKKKHMENLKKAEKFPIKQDDDDDDSSDSDDNLDNNNINNGNNISNVKNVNNNTKPPVFKQNNSQNNYNNGYNNVNNVNNNDFNYVNNYGNNYQPNNYQNNYQGNNYNNYNNYGNYNNYNYSSTNNNNTNNNTNNDNNTNNVNNNTNNNGNNQYNYDQQYYGQQGFYDPQYYNQQNYDYNNYANGYQYDQSNYYDNNQNQYQQNANY